MKFGKSKKQPSCTVLLIVAIAAWVLYGATSWWAGGTTLIELLVVIGMISIFASMLGSSIARAHRHARGEPQQSSPPPEAKPVEPVAEAAKPEPTGVKAPDISIHEAAEDGNIEAVKQHLTDWIIIARIVVIICFGGLGFVLGVVLWVMFSGQFLLTWPGDLYLWSGISAVLGGFIGYGISRWIK